MKETKQKEKQNKKIKKAIIDNKLKELKKIEEYNRSYNKNGWFYGHW